jgi:hypothetical protein
VLLRKHNKIRSQTGVSVPVPASSNALLEALYEGLVLRNRDPLQMYLPFEDKEVAPKAEEFANEWQNAADREKKSRSLFAQNTIKPEVVAQEVQAVHRAIGSAADVQDFMIGATRAHRGTVADKHSRFHFDFTESPLAVKEAVGDREKFAARFDPRVSEGEIYLSRTHPVVDGLASFVMDSALDSAVKTDGAVPAARCGVIRTKAVATRTTLLLLRFRYHILTTVGEETKALLAEDSQIVGFRGAPSEAEWISLDEADHLLEATPDDNVTDDVARNFIQKVIDGYDSIATRLNQIAEARGKEILDAHTRVRQASRRKGVKHAIEPQLPPDVLGVYVYLPVVE